MTRFGADKIEEVRTRADIVEVIGTNIRLKRSGRNFVGLCPFHNEKTPSFSVNAERGFFHCFGCGVGGTVFDFVMKTEGLSFPEALRSLAQRYGIELREDNNGKAMPADERESLFSANRYAADFYAHVLWNTQDGTLARDYLKSRGIAVETARASLIGFAPARPANLAVNLQKRGLLNAGVRAGLIRRDNGGAVADMFRARLMFPIRDPQGRVIAFGGRVLDQRLPKYMNSPESPIYSKARTVYGIFEARQSIGKKDRAIIVEGYIDAIALRQAGFIEAVASLGTSLTVEQLRLLSRYTRNVAACFDGDDAGRKASMRALEVFLQAGLLGRGIFIPTGFDPDTLIKERGAEALAELIDSSELLADFFLREQASSARESIGARARAAERVVEVLRLVANPFEFDILTRKAAGMLGIGEEVLRREARRETVRERGERRTTILTQARPPRRPDAVSQAELGLTGIALRYPALRGEIIAHAGAWRFENSDLGGLIEEVCVSEQPPKALEAEVISRLDEPQRGRLSAMFVDPLLEDMAKARALLADYVRTLAEAKHRRAMEGLRHAASMGDSRAAQELILLRRQNRE